MVNGETRAKFKKLFRHKHHTSNSHIEDEKASEGSSYKEESEEDTEENEIIDIQQLKDTIKENEENDGNSCSGNDREVTSVNDSLRSQKVNSIKNRPTGSKRCLKHNPTRHKTEDVQLRSASDSRKAKSKMSKKNVHPSDNRTQSTVSLKYKDKTADTIEVNQVHDTSNPQREYLKIDKKESTRNKQKQSLKGRSKEKKREKSSCQKHAICDNPTNDADLKHANCCPSRQLNGEKATNRRVATREINDQDKSEESLSKRRVDSNHRTHSNSSSSIESNSSRNKHQENKKEVEPHSWDITQSEYYHKLASLMEINEERRLSAFSNKKKQYMVTLMEPIHSQQDLGSNEDPYSEIYNRFGNQSYRDDKTARTVDFNSDIEIKEYHENAPPRTSKAKKYK
ncbi:hypothetical protein MOSE0_F01728 [Monosporozyma servazzii]